MRSSLKTTYLKALDLLLPPRCPITGEIVDKAGMVSPAAWGQLRFVSAPNCACCGIPFEILAETLPDLTEETLCAVCVAEPRIYRKARASLIYDEASKPLILAFKHGDQTHLTVTFTPWLMTAAKDMIEDADVLVPVPLHWMRLLRRRYNQAALLATSLSRSSGKVCWPDALCRERNTPIQGHLNWHERHKNVAKAFFLRKKYAEKIAGKKILMIDDVQTTGATLEECTKTLLAAGAQRVDVLTLARVVRPDVLA